MTFLFISKLLTTEREMVEWDKDEQGRKQGS
jgi:hypothetical protein